MADRRRRRRRASQDSEDDEESASGSDSGTSGSPATKNRGREAEPPEAAAVRVEAKSDVESECESEDGVGEAVLSDYDSADPEENASHSEGPEEEEEEERAVERYSDEEAPAAASESGPPPGDAPTKAEGEEGEVVVVEEEEVEVAEEEEEEQQQHEEEGEEQEGDGGGGGGNVKESKAEEKGDLAGERQSGDGQESTVDPEMKVRGKPGQKLDDDEDRKNPAYIPRKGLFFEHDVRGHAQEEERPKGRNRKLWKDEGRWEHDRFREEEQAPKSREELVAIYGYDIRNGSGSGEREYRQRRPRASVSPNSREKRWRDAGGQRPPRSWQGGGAPHRGGGAPAASSLPASSSSQRSGHPSRPLPPRSRPVYQSQAPPLHQPQSQYRNGEGGAPQRVQADPSDRERSGRGVRGMGQRGGPPEAPPLGEATDPGTSVRRQPHPQQPAERSGSGGTATTAAPEPQAPPALAQDSSANREASPPAERPVERKSYALARRTRSRPADLGSKQPSVEETPGGGGAGAKSWTGPPAPEGGGGGGGGAAASELDRDVARLSLGAAGQSWSQGPASYIRSEMRGLHGGVHLPAAPPHYSAMEEMGVGSSRAKRYSSQRQRAVPEPAPPLHLGVMEGHYYEPMSYQGAIYAHGEGPAPIPPQSMLVQPEMHLPHPGLHPHQSGGPIASPALYGGPPVSLSPGQPPPPPPPQQLLPPPFYPPPGVVTFPYPAMYPSPQGQSQVTYGGVTYYDTMQQQAQPKPSPPRRTSQPVTVKPPPPEVHFASE